MSALAMRNLAFDSLLIRVVDRAGDPWFVANDVCRAIDVQNPSAAVKILDEDDKAKLNLGLRGSEAIIISEPGLYTLMMRSRDAMTPDTLAWRFRRWVTREVLPTLRRTGGYDMGPVEEPVVVEAFAREDDEFARRKHRLAEMMELRHVFGARAMRQVWLASGCLPEGLADPDRITPVGVIADLHRSVAQWMEVRTTAAPGHREWAMALYDDYTMWCRSGQIEPGEILSMTAFGRALSNCGIMSGKSYKIYRAGLKLVAPSIEE